MLILLSILKLIIKNQNVPLKIALSFYCFSPSKIYLYYGFHCLKLIYYIRLLLNW